jgi:hypothetical protein
MVAEPVLIHRLSPEIIAVDLGTDHVSNAKKRLAQLPAQLPLAAQFPLDLKRGMTGMQHLQRFAMQSRRFSATNGIKLKAWQLPT